MGPGNLGPGNLGPGNLEQLISLALSTFKNNKEHYIIYQCYVIQLKNKQHKISKPCENLERETCAPQSENRCFHFSAHCTRLTDSRRTLSRELLSVNISITMKTTAI